MIAQKYLKAFTGASLVAIATAEKYPHWTWNAGLHIAGAFLASFYLVWGIPNTP